MNPFRRRRHARIIGEIEVLTANILIVDPCHLPADLVHELTHPTEYEPLPRAGIAYVQGDGIYQVFRNPDGSLYID